MIRFCEQQARTFGDLYRCHESSRKCLLSPSPPSPSPYLASQPASQLATYINLGGKWKDFIMRHKAENTKIHFIILLYFSCIFAPWLFILSPCYGLIFFCIFCIFGLILQSLLRKYFLTVREIVAFHFECMR